MNGAILNIRVLTGVRRVSSFSFTMAVNYGYRRFLVRRVADLLPSVFFAILSLMNYTTRFLFVGSSRIMFTYHGTRLRRFMTLTGNLSYLRRGSILGRPTSSFLRGALYRCYSLNSVPFRGNQVLR